MQVKAAPDTPDKEDVGIFRMIANLYNISTIFQPNLCLSSWTLASTIIKWDIWGVL